MSVACRYWGGYKVKSVGHCSLKDKAVTTGVCHNCPLRSPTLRQRLRPGTRFAAITAKTPILKNHPCHNPDGTLRKGSPCDRKRKDWDGEK